MTRRIVQRAIIKVVRPQIVEYLCDRPACGKVCGTRGNPKETWYGVGENGGRVGHYCKKTGCHGLAGEERRQAAEREKILDALAADHARKVT